MTQPMEIINVRTPGGEFIPAGVIRQGVSVPEPLARWEFEEASAPFYTTDGDLPLQIGTGAIAPSHLAGTNSLTKITGPHGPAIRLGGRNWLAIAPADIGRLNVGERTGQVTVSCWFRYEDTNAGAIAGIWREDNANPSRSYALFYGLNYYNGLDRVCGHVSFYGGATPGEVFSKDYSASRETVDKTGTVWEHYAFTYDGEQAISYLNGRGSSFESVGFIDPGGKPHTESKNPYLFDLGLNDAPAEFTVGAVKLTAGMGNLVRGAIADLRVFDVALTPQQIQLIHAKNDA